MCTSYCLAPVAEVTPEEDATAMQMIVKMEVKQEPIESEDGHSPLSLRQSHQAPHPLLIRSRMRSRTSSWQQTSRDEK